jgi:hypothetical protein
MLMLKFQLVHERRMRVFHNDHGLFALGTTIYSGLQAAASCANLEPLWAENPDIGFGATA